MATLARVRGHASVAGCERCTSLNSLRALASRDLTCGPSIANNSPQTLAASTTSGTKSRISMFGDDEANGKNWDENPKIQQFIRSHSGFSSGVVQAGALGVHIHPRDSLCTTLLSRWMVARRASYTSWDASVRRRTRSSGAVFGEPQRKGGRGSYSICN